MKFRTQGLVFALLFFFFMPLAVSAMHIIGGEITYECLGDVGPSAKRYRFTMKIYRDCNSGGAPFDNPANIAIYRGSYNSNSLFATFTVGVLKTEPIPADTPQCVASFPNECVESATYSFLDTLPISATESYFIVYQRCCRNTSISNILTPGDIGATYFMELTPEAQQVCNNSPVFNDFPPIVICNRLPLNFDHSATDPEGDQLVYRLCSPFNGGGPALSPQSLLFSCLGAVPTPPCAPPFTPVPFIAPNFTPSAPMGGNPVIDINSATGLITGTPVLLGQFVVGVCVEEYRNGQLLSVVRRDFQFNVADCNPTVIANVAADTIVGPQQFVISSCGQNTIAFQNLSVQPQFIDGFRWSFDFDGVPYSDSTNWNPVVTFPDTGFYQGFLYLNPGKQCGDTAFISVNIFPDITADFEYDYDTCVAGPVVFTDLSEGDGGINRWDWQFGVPNGTSAEQNPEFLYPIPGLHPVRLRVFDKNNCSDDTLQTINWFPVPPLIIIKPSSFIGCVPAEIFFNNLSTPIDSTYDIIWDFGDGKGSSKEISPTYAYTEPGFYTVQIAITSPIGCFTADTFVNLIRAEPSPTADFSFDPNTALSNFNNTVRFFNESENANRYYWQFGSAGYSNEENPTFVFPDTGLTAVTLIATHPEGCKDSLTKYLDIVPEIRWFMPNAFTPNGDGSNDDFLGAGVLEGVSDFRMTIWNRYGELVFETANPLDGWSGLDQKSGSMSPDGVYVYVVTFTEPRGRPVEYKGFATLIR